MKKKGLSAAVLLFAAALVFMAGFSFGRYADSGNDTQSPVLPPAEDPDPFAGRVAAAPGTDPQMLTAAYWLAGREDRLLFTEEEIADFNRNNPLYVTYYEPIRSKNVKLFMLDLPEELDAYIVNDLINAERIEQMRGDGQPVYINGDLPAGSYWEELKAACACDKIPDTVTPVYAVSVRRAQAYIFPGGDFASGDPGEVFINDFVLAEVMPFTGVVKLHESADKSWSFVISDSGCGWVKSEDICLCENRDEWLEAIYPEDFLLVTGCEIVMDETALPSASSGMILPMGTRVRLCEDVPELVNGRSPLAAYAVEIPVRKEDGSLGWEQALVPAYQDVHIGNLSMTSSSVIEQAFKFLGKVYGWGGSLSSNDCSGFIRQVYSCFGFELPRNSITIAKLADLGSSKCGVMSTARKLQILEKMPPGQILHMDGHLMLYLGMDGGEPYVISSCASYIRPGDKDLEIRQANCVFVSGLDLLRANGKTWLEDLQYLQWKDY